MGASAAGSIAIGNSSSSPEVDSVALGNSANASLGSSTVIGASANSFGNSGTSVGKGASVQGTSGITIGANSIGWTDGIAPDSGILIGTNSNDYNGITIGHGSNPSSGYYRNIIIGHGISPAADDATYMNKFRTGVTPVGTEWTLKWDDSTNEVYASLGGSTGPNWYAYQVQPFPGSSFSVAMPSGMPTGSFGFGNSLFSTQSTFSGTPSPSGAWTYLGTTGYYNSVYAVGSPQPSPESYFGSAFGVIIIYYRGYETDSGATSTVDVNTGTSLYSSFTNNIYCSSFSTFGTTKYGHAIVAISGNFVGSITPGGGVTLVEEFYDSGSGNTYAFFDLDSSAVSLVGSGAAIATITSSAGYDTIFWYNYV